MMTRRNRQLLIGIASVLVPAALVAIALAMELPPAQFYSVTGAFVQLGALFFGPYLLCLAIAHFARTYWGVFALVPFLGLETAFFAVMHDVQGGVTSKADSLLEILGGFAGFTVVWAIALGVFGVLLMLVVVTALACAEVARPLFRRRSSRH